MSRILLALGLSLVLAGAEARADGGDGGVPAPQAPAEGASRDVVTLKDGRRLEGEIVAEDDRFISFRSGGVTRAYARDSIASVERTARAPVPAGPAAAPGQPAPPPGDPAGRQMKKDKADRSDSPLSDAAKSWLDQLLARTSDPDETIRRSAGAAIGAMGPQAIPAVRAAADAAADGAQKQFLTKLAADMEQRRDRKMRGDDMGPGGPMPPEEPGVPRGGPPRRGVDDMMRRLDADLELREDQRPKVETVLGDALKQRFDLLREARREGLTAEQVAEKVTPLRADLLAKMKGVLDEPQYALFEEMATRLFDMQRGGGPLPPQPPKPAPSPQDPPK